MGSKNSIFNLSKRQKAWLTIIVALPVTVAYSNIAYKRFVKKEYPKPPPPKDQSKLDLQIEQHLQLLEQERLQQQNDSLSQSSGSIPNSNSDSGHQ